MGSAVVEKASRALEQSEIERCDEIYGGNDDCAEMVNVVKSFTNSIWVESGVRYRYSSLGPIIYTL